MAVTYGFYDSLNHDRLYNAQQMSAIFDGIINDGVFMSVGNQFHTVAGTGMQVIVKSGRAWFDSTWTLNDAEYPLSIDAADVLLTRIDAVVLEVNSEVATRANTIKVVKGTPASTPAKPTLTNTATIHQHALAYVTVAKNITAITNSMIEIVVGKTETPYVTAILQTTDITDLYNQWEDYFQTWFDTVRGTLDGDVALNLQNQITTLRRDTLKNTTPPIIGLPSSATPDDMFRALAKTGDLHVWRKTIVTAQKIPAGYTLGTRQKIKLFYMWGTDGISISYSSSVIVYDNGDIALSKPSTIDVRVSSNPFTDQFSVLKGMFVKISATKTSSSAEPGIHFIPTDATYSVTGSDPSSNLYCNNCQTVTGYAAIPARTTTTYPVSTNPNTYQEGSDAKPAWYVIGSLKTGTFHMADLGYSDAMGYIYSDSITVTDNGAINFVSPSTFDANVSEYSANDFKNKFAGKFVRMTRINSGYIGGAGWLWESTSTPSIVIYIPKDATFVRADRKMSVDRYQPVTGYAAVPAGTTIEYLGKLGNKAMVQVVSYVGTGTYGNRNPTVIELDIVPKIVFIAENVNYQPKIMTIVPSTLGAFGAYLSGGSVYGLISPDVTITGKRISFFSATSSEYQMNDTGNKYFAIAIG